MALDVIVTTTRIAKDPNGRDLVNYLREQSNKLRIEPGVLYYDFPTYSDYETISHKPDALLVSAHHGIIAIRFVDTSETSSAIEAIDESLSQFCSILIGRLLRSPTLRKTLSSLRFEVSPVLISSNKSMEVENCATVGSFDGLSKFLTDLGDSNLDGRAIAEMRSVIEGAKALTRPKKRIIENPAKQLFGVAFTLLLCKLYYSNYWDEHWTIENGTRVNKFEEDLKKEKEKCAKLGGDFFLDAEHKCFHFA